MVKLKGVFTLILVKTNTEKRPSVRSVSNILQKMMSGFMSFELTSKGHQFLSFFKHLCRSFQSFGAAVANDDGQWLSGVVVENPVSH
jgi:hypothetical protein